MRNLSKIQKYSLHNVLPNPNPNPSAGINLVYVILKNLVSTYLNSTSIDQAMPDIVVRENVL